jgi:hypothetical protein
MFHNMTAACSSPGSSVAKLALSSSQELPDLSKPAGPTRRSFVVMGNSNLYRALIFAILPYRENIVVAPASNLFRLPRTVARDQVAESSDERYNRQSVRQGKHNGAEIGKGQEIAC